jgi:gliding-associated putative ABC transporter substrate-binding component GldG
MEVSMKFDLKRSVFLSVAAIGLALVLLNLVSRNWFIRLDLTDNKMYSLSESSKNVLKQIDDLLTMKVYFSDDLPGEYGNNRRYLQDILEEYAAFSDGNLRFEFYKPGADDKLEQEAQKAGVQPVQLQVVENDKMEVKRVLMGLTIQYEDQKEVIPLIQSTTGLEYEITTKIKKLVDANKKIIAIVNTGEDPEIQNQNISMLLRQRYQVRNINLAQSIPDNIDVILINGVKDSLSTDAKENLTAFINRGGNIFIAQGRIYTDLQTQRATPIQSDIFDLLYSSGLNIQENLVLDRNCSRVSVQQNMGFIRMNVPMEYPFLPIVRNFNKDEIIVKGLEQLSVFFPSEIDLDSVPNNVNVTPLFSTSNRSSTMTGSYNLNPDPKSNPALRALNGPGKILAAKAEISNIETGLNSQIILISDSRFLLDDGGGRIPENHIFLMNAIDYLAGDQDLIALRSREITNRPLEDISDDAKKTWKWINITLPSILIIGFGFFRLQRQRKRASILEEIYD